MGIKIFQDGDQWCVLCGSNLQEGTCGFGDTPQAAWDAFVAECAKLAKQHELVAETLWTISKGEVLDAGDT